MPSVKIVQRSVTRHGISSTTAVQFCEAARQQLDLEHYDGALLLAVHALLDVARRSAKRSDLQNAADAVRLLDEHKQLFASATIYALPLPPGQSAWPGFLEWAVGQARSIARG